MRLRIAALSALGACASTDPLVLEHRAVLSYATRGMALADDGVTGHAGMYETTCDFRPRTGAVGADYDFVGSEDTVVDGADGPTAGFGTLVLTERGLHVVHPNTGASVDLGVPSAAHGAIVGDEVLVIGPAEGGCEGRWVLPGDPVPRGTVDLPGGACDPTAEVASDHASAVFVATDDGVVVVRADGVERLDVRADRLAWDPHAGALYAADLGSSEIRAHEPDGALRWEVDVGGRVEALGDLGRNAAASVSVSAGTGGALVVLDGATGEVRADLATPTAARDLVASGDGSTLGVVLERETHFYEVGPLE